MSKQNKDKQKFSRHKVQLKNNPYNFFKRSQVQLMETIQGAIDSAATDLVELQKGTQDALRKEDSSGKILCNFEGRLLHPQLEDFLIEHHGATFGLPSSEFDGCTVLQASAEQHALVIRGLKGCELKISKGKIFAELPFLRNEESFFIEREVRTCRKIIYQRHDTDNRFLQQIVGESFFEYVSADVLISESQMHELCARFCEQEPRLLGGRHQIRTKVVLQYPSGKQQVKFTCRKLSWQYDIDGQDITYVPLGAENPRKDNEKMAADHFRDQDYSKLSNNKFWCLMGYMGLGINFGSRSPEAEKTLKEVLVANPAKAFIGYEVIVLNRQPKNISAEATAEVSKLAALQAFMNDAHKKMEEAHPVYVQQFVEQATAQLKDAAQKAIIEAATHYRPLQIKEREETRVVQGVLPPEFNTMIQLASARIPILLVGPAGCGKTYLCEKLAEALGMTFADQSCSEGMSESVFNGLLLPLGKGGEFQHVPTPFMNMYENGGVMLLDEIDAGDPNLYTYINKAIANQSYSVAQRYKNPNVKKHDDFVLVCAANTFGNGADAMYVGRNQLDAATLDRFKVGMITMDYNKEVELSLAPRELCEWAWGIRHAIQAKKLRRIMSTRTIKDMAVMQRMYGWQTAQWEEAYFSGWSVSEKTALVQGLAEIPPKELCYDFPKIDAEEDFETRVREHVEKGRQQKTLTAQERESIIRGAKTGVFTDGDGTHWQTYSKSEGQVWCNDCKTNHDTDYAHTNPLVTVTAPNALEEFIVKLASNKGLLEGEG